MRHPGCSIRHNVSQVRQTGYSQAVIHARAARPRLPHGATNTGPSAAQCLRECHALHLHIPPLVAAVHFLDAKSAPSRLATTPTAHPSNLFLNSLSFCSTSSSNLSTPYFNASLLCLTTLAFNLSSLPSFLPPAAAAFPPFDPARDEESASRPPSRPCCRSARARRVSTRRSWRSRWASARSRRRDIKGVISERREDSAAVRVGCGMSS